MFDICKLYIYFSRRRYAKCKDMFNQTKCFWLLLKFFNSIDGFYSTIYVFFYRLLHHVNLLPKSNGGKTWDFFFFFSWFVNGEPSSVSERILWICIRVCHLFSLFSNLFIERGAICQWIHYQWRKNCFYLLIVWISVPFFWIFSSGSCRSWKNERLFDSFEVVICWQQVQNLVRALHNKHFDGTKESEEMERNGWELRISFTFFIGLTFQNTLQFHYFN